MAEIKITSLADQAALEQYTALRNAARDTIQHGVYPNCVNSLAAYSTLSDALAGELSEFADYHADTMALVLPHVQSIQQAMETIVGTVKAIDVAAHEMQGVDIFGTYTQEGEELDD